MSPLNLWHRRRGVVVATALAVAVGAGGCQAQSGPKAGDLQTWLRQDAAVAAADAHSEGSRLSSAARATAQLKTGADAAAFRSRLGSYLRSDASLKTAQVDVTADGTDDFSVVADQARTDASAELGSRLRREIGATQARGFIGDVEVTIQQPEQVTATFDKLAADDAVKRVSGDGTIRVHGGDMELGKAGKQPLDPSFEPAIKAALAAGATSVRAFMDRDHGPTFDVTAPDPTKLSPVLDGLRSNGYTGPTTLRSGKVLFNDDTQISMVPYATAIGQTSGVDQVSLVASHTALDPNIHSTFRVDVNEPSALTRVASLVDADEAEEAGMTEQEKTARHSRLATLRNAAAPFSLVFGPNRAEGSAYVILQRATMVQSLVHQAGVAHVVFDDQALSVAFPESARDQIPAALSDLRAHRWIGNRPIELQIVQGDTVTESARFDSTATGVASVPDSGTAATATHDLIDLWDSTATR